MAKNKSCETINRFIPQDYLGLETYNSLDKSVKTKGHIFTQKELNSKFPFVDLIAIERFEKIIGIKFDHSKFNNRAEFQEYFAKWLDSQRK